MSGVQSLILRLAGSADIRSDFAAASGLGYESVALDAISREIDLLTAPVSALRDLYTVAARNGLTIGTLWLDDARLYLSSRGDVERLVTQAERALEAARTTGATGVVVQLGRVHAATPVPTVKQPSIDDRIAAAGMGLVLPTPDEVNRLVGASSGTSRAAPGADDALASIAPAALRELATLADHFRMPLVVVAGQSPLADVAHAVAAAGCRWLVPMLDALDVLAEGLTPSGAVALGVAGGGVPAFGVRDGLVGGAGHSQPTRVQEVQAGAGGVPWADWASAIADLPSPPMILVDPSGVADRRKAAAAALATMRKHEICR